MLKKFCRYRITIPSDRLFGIVVSSLRLTAIQEVPGSIPGYTLEIFLEVQRLERGPPSLVRTIGQLLDMRRSEIRLRKLTLMLRGKRFANLKAPCTAIWQQPLQSVLALRGCSATDLLLCIYLSIQFIDLFNYLLTNWLLRNPIVHHCPYIIPPLVFIFSKFHPVPRITAHLFQIYFVIFLPCASRPL